MEHDAGAATSLLINIYRSIAAATSNGFDFHNIWPVVVMVKLVNDFLNVIFEFRISERRGG
jgi:hypothetical protein